MHRALSISTRSISVCPLFFFTSKPWKVERRAHQSRSGGAGGVSMQVWSNPQAVQDYKGGGVGGGGGGSFVGWWLVVLLWWLVVVLVVVGCLAGGLFVR